MLRTFILRALAGVGAVALGAALLAGFTLASAIRGGFAARDQPSALEARAARAARRLAVPSRAKALENPLPATSETLANGRVHWADHCALCHGNDGSGDTEIGRSLYPKAPDMRADATQSLSDGELYYIIQNGIRLSGMPAWGDRAVDDDEGSWSLVAFIRHLPQLAPDELTEMQKLNPKSPDDWREEQEEEEFLRGEPAEGAPRRHHHH